MSIYFFSPYCGCVGEFCLCIYELPLTNNKSSFVYADTAFFFLISAKNDFVFADGFVVILPATFGVVPDFFVTTFLWVVVLGMGANFFGGYLF